MKNTGKTTQIGTLVMASNHIGCTDDIPNRALETLKTADLVVFEEDRPARHTLKAAGIRRDYLKFNEHHQTQTLDEVAEALKKGRTVIYMSDQGSPALADPGRFLNEIAFSIGAKVTTIPGPSSLTAALSAAPFDCRTFKYLGFPPKDPGLKQSFFESELNTNENLVLMDTPYRLKNTIAELAKSFPNRKGLLAIDVSGPDENFIYGPFSKINDQIDKRKLNFVLVVEGNKRASQTRHRKKKN